MKKKTKKIFGLVGLALVIGVTAVACSLPSPRATATQSLTDTIQVRVVGDTPDVRFVSIVDNEKMVYPNIPFSISYENIDNYTLKIKHTDKDGNVTESIIDAQNVDYNAGEKNYLIKFDEEGESTDEVFYGGKYEYGEYYMILEGVGYSISDYDYRTFNYLPVIGEILYNEDTGVYTLNLDYATEEEGGEVDKIKVQIYSEDGALLKTIDVNAPNKSIEIDLSCEKNEESCTTKSGKIYALINAYNAENPDEALYEPHKTNEISYEGYKVPDTGSFLKELNISREDFLVTGLIIFGIVAIAGVVFLKKTDTNKKRAHVNAKRRRK